MNQRKAVNKALEDFQQQDSEEDNRRWMWDSDFQSGYNDFPIEEKFQGSCEDSSSNDDYHCRRNRFISISSKAKDSSEDERAKYICLF